MKDLTVNDQVFISGWMQSAAAEINHDTDMGVREGYIREDSEIIARHFKENLIPKTILEGARCYLSGPIENDKTGINWRVQPKKILTQEFGINLFDPFDDPKQVWVDPLMRAREACDYVTMARIAKGFVRKDLAMVDRADFIISHLPRGVPTTGTHHEIINSVNTKKPTLLVCPQGKQYIPLWYYGFIPHEVMFGSWDELYAYLHEVNEGRHKGNNRWAFVYGLV